MNNKRILVVDDTPAILQLCARVLGEEDYQVHTASRGLEALARLEKEPFDLLLLDIKMPDLDGLTVLRRATELDPGVTAIIITGYGTLENAIQALQAGARGFLLKPFDPERLLRVVAEAMEARRQEREHLLLRARLPLLEISQAMMAAGHLESLPRQLLEVVIRQIGADRASLMLLAEGTGELHTTEIVGLPHDAWVETWTPTEQSVVRQVLLRKEPRVLSGEVIHDPVLQALGAGPDAPLVCVPLHRGGREIGVLNLGRPSGSPSFTPSELDLLSIMAGHITTALENARLYEQARRETAERRRFEKDLRRQNEYLSALHETALGLFTRRPLVDLLETIVERVCALMGTPHGYIYLVEPGMSVIELQAGRGLYSRSIGHRLEAAEDLAGKVWSTGQPLIVDDYHSWPGRAPQSRPHPRFDPLHTAAGVPLRFDLQNVGVLGLAYEEDQVFGFEEIALLSQFADLASIAVDNARLYEQAQRQIAERKQMEQALLRTERLAAMGHLAAALAHEINNPLQSIENSMELALDFPLQEEERQEYLEAVRQEIERLIALTSRVLDFARPPQVERRPTSVAEVLRYALTLAGKHLAHSRIELSSDLPEDLPLVPASFDQLAQVFLNLIINAVEAMPHGGKLRISARSTDGEVELTFADSGPGIPPDMLDKVFEPFQTTKEDGTGLGLAVSYSIIRQHGGAITAGNARDGGAVFAVTLPLAPSGDS